MEARLRFAVLGPVRAWRGSDEIELGPPQQRAVLAALLLAEGSQVPASGLIDAVWGTRAPASAPGILRTYVHRLRKALEPAGDTASSVLRSTGDGYQLRISPEELDLGAFRELLARAERARRAGDPKGAVGYLRDALDLWRGTALAGVRGEYAQAQRHRLGELRLSAEAARITAELDLGVHAEATAELTGLVTEHPLDERFRELLMLALYRSGQQAAALATYRDAQTLLAGELGVDPGPALQAMYQRVLRADAGLLAPLAPAEPAPVPAQAPAPLPVQAPAVPAQLPAGLAVFVGRDAELAEAARLPTGGTVVVSAIAGMAGVGKTTFAVRWARQVADRFPDGQLYLNLRGFDPVGLPVAPEHALRTLLESLGAGTRGLPQGVDALAALYRTLLTGKRMLVLLDNARDAAQVRPLLPGAPGCLVIVTSRDRLAGLVAVDGAHPLHLDLLSVPEARALLTRRLGQGRVAAEPDAVEEIIARCGRLPLALAVTAARAAIRSALPLSAIAAELRDSADGLDWFHDGDAAADVRAVFSWSYHALTTDAARLFRLLGMHPGPDIALPAAAGLAGLTIPHTRQLLSELVQAHLVDESVPGRYASHDLLRAFATELTEALDPPQEARTARHRMFDHYLHTAREALALTARTRVLISLAPAVEGVRPEEFNGDTAKAVAWFTAERAVLLAGIEQAATHGYDVHTWQLAWAVASYLHRCGLWREHEAVHRTALDAARRLGDTAAEAHVLRLLAFSTADMGRVEEARAHAERAIELFTESGDTRACAEGYFTLSWVEERQGDPEAALAAAQRYLALSSVHDGHGVDDSRDRMTTACALNVVGWFQTCLGQHQQALDHCQQAVTLFLELGDETGAAATWDSIGHAYHHLGQYEQAVTAFRNTLDLSRRGDLPLLTAGTLRRLGDTHLSAADPDAARAAWVEGLDILERIGHADAESLRTRLRQLDEPSDLVEADAAPTDS
ncbi:tetratricopeptide repeat protein [Streptomyces sp. NBC_01478]|uniref:AfsR/SARP family transcriptional regulator n=1 Tax=Streptomyces sp. NBC_01478 TaxID=2903882 RepID=UPI002E3517C1|nr:BTAD domain-containing putative transcriptional regulator [Streptomyces sp. NBC_01478]